MVESWNLEGEPEDQEARRLLQRTAARRHNHFEDKKAGTLSDTGFVD